MRHWQRLHGEDYRTLAEFRYLLRCFSEFSETLVRQNGLTTWEHQALLIIKGLPGKGPTIGDLAEHLRIHQNDAVALMNQLVASNLVVPHANSVGRHHVRFSLTATGEAVLRNFATIHLEELRRIRPRFLRLLSRIKECDQEYS